MFKVDQSEKIAPDTAGRCIICNKANINTGSAMEYGCTILNDWICETHCTEIDTLPGYEDARRRLAEIIGWKNDSKELLNICKTCPHHGEEVGF